jgi:hypothetical protein
MPVAIVPNEQVLGAGAGFVLNPAPNVVLYQDMIRMGPNPNMYELINPSMRIDVVATGGCPLPLVPELITGISIKPGHGHPTPGGAGCSVATMIDIAPAPVPNIPEMLMIRGFSEPYMEYGTIASPPVPALSLPSPLIGYISEKYFYDAEFIYATYYDPYADVIPDTFPIQKQNRMTAISLLNGKRSRLFSEFDSGLDQVTDAMFGTGAPIPLNVITDESALLPNLTGVQNTYGNDYLKSVIPETSFWIKFKPSFIKTMIFYYTVVVTHTCPPYVTTFLGQMTVHNGWTPFANRLAYYIDNQVGFLEAPV